MWEMCAELSPDFIYTGTDGGNTPISPISDKITPISDKLMIRSTPSMIPFRDGIETFGTELRPIFEISSRGILQDGRFG